MKVCYKYSTGLVAMSSKNGSDKTVFVSTPCGGLGRKTATKLDIYLALGMKERRKNSRPPCVLGISCTAGMVAVQTSKEPKREPVCSALLGHSPTKFPTEQIGGKL